MDAEERTQKAIQIARTILYNVFDNPGAILAMTVNDVSPEEVENKVVQNPTLSGEDDAPEEP